MTAAVIFVQMISTRETESTATDVAGIPTPAATQGGEAPDARPLPDCRKGEEPALLTSYDEWPETLVDTHFALDADYAPDDLRPVSKAGFSGDFEVRKVALKDLERLRKDADQAGNPLGIVAAYRDYATQQDLYDERVKLYGRDATQARTARPGHSEHQLGVAVDFRSEDADDVDQDWEQTPEGAWMAEHAVAYGFVMSYPRQAEDITCYDYEPWHYRYFGPKRAAEISASGQTVREYLWSEQPT
ncbi:MAG: D-alanyl-D-alanine carboxypeptidase family protein [Actinomycetota bacterium]